MAGKSIMLVLLEPLKHERMKNATTLIAASAVILGMSCSKTEQVQPPSTTTLTEKSQGAGHAIPNQQAYYDDELFTINLMELSEHAAASILAHNQGVNEIYASEDLDDPQTFHPVIDAIPGD